MPMQENLRDWKYSRIQLIRKESRKGVPRKELEKRFGYAIVDQALNWRPQMMYN